MSITFIVVLSILSAVMGAGVVSLWQEWRNMKAEIVRLKQASDKRHLPYKTAEEIENATAAILVAMREIDFDKTVLENALAHLHKARNNQS